MPTEATPRVRVAERRAIQDENTKRSPRRWFSVTIGDVGPSTVIAGGLFPKGVAYCVVHASKTCDCVKAVIERAFLEDDSTAPNSALEA